MLFTFNSEILNSQQVIRMWVSLEKSTIDAPFTKHIAESTSTKYIVNIKMIDSKVLTEEFSSKEIAFKYMDNLKRDINSHTAE